MAIELNIGELARAGLSIGVEAHQLEEHIGVDFQRPVSLAAIARSLVGLPVTLHGACRLTASS
jgi:hypothetical protein